MGGISVRLKLTRIAVSVDNPGGVVLTLTAEEDAWTPNVVPSGVLTLVVDEQSEGARLPLGAKLDAHLNVSLT